MIICSDCKRTLWQAHNKCPRGRKRNLLSELQIIYVTQFKALTKCSLLRGLLYLTCEMKMLSEGQECTEDRLDLLKTQENRFLPEVFLLSDFQLGILRNLHKYSFIPANAAFALQRERSLGALRKTQLKVDWRQVIFCKFQIDSQLYFTSSSRDKSLF